MPVTEAQKLWRKNNRDKVKERAAVYRAKHKDAIKERWNSKREQYNTAQLNKYREFPERVLLSAAKVRAKEKSLEFNLDVSDIVIPDVCPVFGTPFEKGTWSAASLDRINPTKGYIKGNVQVLSKKANTMKQNATKDELKRFAEWILSNE